MTIKKNINDFGLGDYIEFKWGKNNKASGYIYVIKYDMFRISSNIKINKGSINFFNDINLFNHRYNIDFRFNDKDIIIKHVKLKDF